MEQSDTNIISQVIFNSKSEFEELFRANYGSLCSYANKFLEDVDASEEVVQEMFYKLWTNRDSLSITSSIKSYLFRAVRNSCLNVIKHVDIREEYKAYNEQDIKNKENSFEEEIVATELEQRINEAIDKLPVERRRVFIMSRYDGLKYKEIAEKQGISIKTVENQMGKALKFLREELADYMPLAILVLIELFNR